MWLSKVAAVGRTYAENCYHPLNSSQSSESCEIFTTLRIDLSEQRGECPFNQSICAKIERPGLVIDSNLVDLNTGFGMNLPRRDRMRYRRKATCSVLNMTNRYTVVDRMDKFIMGRDLYPKEELVLVHLGNGSNKLEEYRNITTIVSLLGSNMTKSINSRYVLYQLQLNFRCQRY